MPQWVIGAVVLGGIAYGLLQILVSQKRVHHPNSDVTMGHHYQRDYFFDGFFGH